MKTTVEISDELLERARRHAKREGRPVRALIEDGLRLLLAREAEAPKYRLPDRSVGKAGDENPLDALSWSELRDEIYGGR